MTGGVYRGANLYTMKHLFVLFVIALPCIGSAQVSGNYMFNNSNRWNNVAAQIQATPQQHFDQHHMQVTTKALFNAKATSYLAIFHVTQVGPTARGVDSLMQARIDGFKAEIAQVGVTDRDVYVDMLNLVPVFEVEKVGRVFSKRYNEVPAGFEMQKNIHVRFTDAEVLDRLVTAAAFEEIYDLVKVEYFIDNLAEIYAELRSQATELLQGRLAQFDSLGIAVEGQWLLAKDHKAMYQPQDRYSSYKAFTNTSLEASVRKGQVTQMKRPSTHYYDKLSYADFDLIANPEILEPVVQLTYQLDLQIELRRPEPKPEPEPQVRIETQTRYFLLDQAGDIKPLELHD